MRARRARINKLYLFGLASVAVVTVLIVYLAAGDAILQAVSGMGGGNQAANDDSADNGDADETEPAGEHDLTLFCAAGMRYPMDEIVQQYAREFDVKINVDYAGSNTLLSRIEAGKSGDLYLAADDSYLLQAREKGLAVESIPLAQMRPVIAVKSDNPKSIASIDDLLKEGIRVGIGQPDAAAVGKKTRRLLSESGQWEALNKRVEADGVFQPTVNEVANDVLLGTIDAAIIWDSTVAQYSDLKAIRAPELDRGTATIEICVLASSKRPTAALRFARFVSAHDKGLLTFRKKGFDVLDGDKWELTPELILYAGAVNRGALEPIIKEFETREGVRVNTRFDGCGILTSQMRILQDGGEGAFPDSFMACDIYYLQKVQDLFDEGIIVSDTDIVIAVKKGNPEKIESLADLTRPGLRVALGQPTQCTIGVLSKQLLENEGIADDVMKNVVQQTTSSAPLVPAVTEGGVDAALAYRTDTLSERNQIDVVPINSRLAKAIQPYSVARSSDQRHLSQRLFDAISRSRDKFESAGFNWRLDRPGKSSPGS